MVAVIISEMQILAQDEDPSRQWMIGVLLEGFLYQKEWMVIFIQGLVCALFKGISHRFHVLLNPHSNPEAQVLVLKCPFYRLLG